MKILRNVFLAAVLLIFSGHGFNNISQGQVAPPFSNPAGPVSPPPPPFVPGAGNPPVPPSGDPGKISLPPVKMISPGVLEIGGVRIIKRDNKIEFPCRINMNRGQLEYLIVGGSGKLHESLLRTDVEPFSIQMALLLLGLEGTSNPLAGQGDPRTPEGDSVNLWVQWEHAGQINKARIEEWVVMVPTGTVMLPPGTMLPSGTVLPPGTPMPSTNWVFTGSMIGPNGMFMAQFEKSIVAIFHDPVALIDNPMPEGASDKIWFVEEAKTPPVGTDVTVIIKKAEEMGK